MPKNDLLSNLVYQDIRSKYPNLEAAAQDIGFSLRQFSRHLNGKTKKPVMDFEVVCTLRDANIIGNDTAEVYVQEIRKRLVYKREKPGCNRVHGKMLNRILTFLF